MFLSYYTCHQLESWLSSLMPQDQILFWSMMVMATPSLQNVGNGVTPNLQQLVQCLAQCAATGNGIIHCSL